MSHLRIKIFFYGPLLIVILSALLTPGKFDEFGPAFPLYEFSDLFPGIRSLREMSDFPAALVTTGFISIALGIGLAIIFSLSDFIKKFASLLLVSRGTRGAVVIVLIGIALPYVVLSTVMQGHSHTAADSFFFSIATNRLYLAFWGAGVFLIFFFCLAGFVGALFAIFFARKVND